MSRLYKVDSDKGFKILCATSPAVIFVNGIRFSEINLFIDRFKSTEMDLLNLENVYNRIAVKFNVTKEILYEYFADATQFGNTLDWEKELVKELHVFLTRFRTTSCVIYGDIGAMGMISKIFNDDFPVFTYVYMYPDSGYYRKTVLKWLDTHPNSENNGIKLLDDIVKKRDPKIIDNFIKKMLESRKQNFKVHTEALGYGLIILGPK